MPFDTSTRLFSLLAERINVPIRNEKRSDTNCIKPITSYGAIDETRTHTFIQTLPPQSSASTYSATIANFPKWEMFFNQFRLHHLEDKC